MQIRGFSLPEVIESSEVAVDLAEKALRLYSELFGPYERDVLSVVQADMDINMEFDGLILIQSSFYWLCDPAFRLAYHRPSRGVASMVLQPGG